ncbi:hypothetical protein [Endozoicomonas sp. 8E]|uniref:hypothetical protein n=1 Tax=Endozoicomonas sp. 8E TaxID=3035692 RepID=UPI00293924B0|nr:hypothetical protein [Endozoicomonas sp. 8E]WOG29758.1 hypothetical protein P6910_08910 [Endozoicomonas sp. 8E]
MQDLFKYLAVSKISFSWHAQSLIDRTMGQGTEIDSRRKRFKRFFARSAMGLDDMARIVLDWMLPEGNWVVCLDPTNWDLGQFKINIMMVANSTA